MLNDTVVTVILIAFFCGLYIVGKSAIVRLVHRVGREKNIAPRRTLYVSRVIGLVWGLVSIILIGMAAGINYEELSIFFTSAFAVIGVALFAQWSILSNVTASIIVFFFFPYRVGDHVRIVDGDNSVEGMIDEITLFHVIMRGEDKQLITYPNTLVFQKTVIIDKGDPQQEKVNNEENGDW